MTDTPILPIPVYYFSLTLSPAQATAAFMARHSAPPEELVTARNAQGAHIVVLGPVPGAPLLPFTPVPDDNPTL